VITPVEIEPTWPMEPVPERNNDEARELVTERKAPSTTSLAPSRNDILSVREASIVWWSMVAIE
jgi:hypothetical protein